jgi:hypothetical protein
MVRKTEGMMAVEERTQWDVGVSSWIIQDGNYDDFQRGQVAAFALAWWGELRPADVPLKRADPLGPARYAIQGEVVYAATDAADPARAHLAVLDFGLCAYRDARDEILPPGITRGGFVAGEVGLGIDYYYYMEFHHTWPQIPPLIYTWRIDRISQLSAPWILTTTPWGAPARMRDAARMSYVDIEQTRAWEDEEGHADYILHCVLLEATPRRPIG